MGEKLVAFLAAPKRLRRARAEGSKYKQTQNACVLDYSSSLIFRRENLTPILFEKYKPRISANLGESHSTILALTNLRFVRGIACLSAMLKARACSRHSPALGGMLVRAAGAHRESKAQCISRHEVHEFTILILNLYLVILFSLRAPEARVKRSARERKRLSHKQDHRACVPPSDGECHEHTL